MSFYAYMLRCSDGKYYVGHTDALERRFAQHQRGEIKGYTQTRRPVTLVWSQDFPSRLEALEAERQIKGWGRPKKEALIAGDWDKIRALASRAVLRDAASTSSAAPQDERVFPSIRAEEGLNECEAYPEPAATGGSRRGPSRSIGVTPPPAIILVRPQLAENIGKAARAMLNFGLTDMRLVTPRDGWPNPSAGPAASGADLVLERARVYESVADAVADCPHVYATTVRRRGVTKPVVTPEEAIGEVRSQSGQSAFLFGPERSGLETDDVAIARTIVTVPINPEFGSLNLAQAVILLAYEWSRGESLAQPPEVDLPEPAPQEELDGMIAQIDALLEAANFYFPPDRVPATKRTLRTLLTKPGWSAQEVRTLRGVFSALQPKRRG